MKRTVLAMVWIAISMAAMQTACAQTNPKRGYVITNENDTIHGTIDYRTNARNAIQCDFLADGATAYTTYRPGDIAGYRLADGGPYYVSRNFPVNGTRQTVFAQYLVLSGMSLYYLKDDGDDHYYFENEDGEVAELKKANRHYDSGAAATRERQTEMKDATRLFVKSRKAVDQLWKSNMSVKDMVDITTDYNREFCTDDDCEVFAYADGRKGELKVRLRVEAGMGIGGLTAKGGDDDYSITLSGVCPEVAAGIDLQMPRLSRNLSLQLLAGASYQNYSKDGKGLKSYFGHDYARYEAKYWLLKLQAGVAYSILPERKVSPLLRGGVTINRMTGMSTEGLHGLAINNTDLWSTDFGLYAGGGADIRLGRHIGRIACNYQWFSNHQASVNTHAVALSLGLLF